MVGGPDYRGQLDTRCDSGRAQSRQRRRFPDEPMKRVPQIKIPRPLPELHAFPLGAASTQKKVHRGANTMERTHQRAAHPTTSPQGTTSPLAVIRDGRLSQFTSKTGWGRSRHRCATSSRIVKVQIHFNFSCLNV